MDKNQKFRVKAFRPWNLDSLATIVKATPMALTIRYDHAPEQTYVLQRRDADIIGRVVYRDTLDPAAI